MKVISLQSGSNGNCFYVEAGDVRLLFDAGISAKQAAQRLATHGREIGDCDALLISHDHSDHAKSMGVFQRKFGLPVYVTRRTLAASQRFLKVGKVERVRLFTAGSSLSFGRNGEVAVHTVPTPHDSAEGVAFVVEYEGQRVGILTDLGHAFDGLRDVLKSLDAVIIESNYDEEMLEYGRYPDRLKRRIRGSGGHLSNDDSARLLKAVLSESAKPASSSSSTEEVEANEVGSRLQWACLCHLSQDNNRPELAKQAHEDVLGDRLPIYVASRTDVSDVMEVRPKKLV
jgi:phosphoribosyl 1,2-cyclic phosphodiesterase